MFTLEGLSELLYNVESTKDKTLETDPNLERNTMIFQGIEKMYTPYQVIWWGLFKLCLISYLQRNKTILNWIILRLSNVPSCNVVN